jgi:hypothetical protein
VSTEAFWAEGASKGFPVDTEDYDCGLTTVKPRRDLCVHEELDYLGCTTT